MANIRSSEVRYKCKVCAGHGEVDIGWYAAIIVPCENCEGTGKCDWMRRAMPVAYDENTGGWGPAK